MKPKVLPRAKILQSTGGGKQVFVDPGNSDELIPISIPVIDYTKMGVPVLDFTEDISIEVKCDTTEMRAVLSTGLAKILFKAKIGSGLVMDASIVVQAMHLVYPDGTDLYQCMSWFVSSGLSCIMTVVNSDTIIIRHAL